MFVKWYQIIKINLNFIVLIKFIDGMDLVLAAFYTTIMIIGTSTFYNTLI